MNGCRRHFSCIDSKTGKELLLSGVSYNAACMWLDSELKKHGKSIISCFTDWKHDLTVIETETRKFFYDENRGYLLGE